jgi:hypothetical protein
VVAAAILGVGVVTALTALDTMLAGASEATQQAAATCLLRAEVGRLEAAPWDSGGDFYPNVDKSSVSVVLKDSGDPLLQIIEVTAKDSAGRTAATATVLKAFALSQPGSKEVQSYDPPAGWCSYPLRAAP